MSAVLKACVALVAVAVLVAGWRYLPMLRGTPLNEVRFVLFTAAAFLVLSAAEWIAGRIGAAMDRDRA